jgi:hypothetical protein
MCQAAASQGLSKEDRAHVLWVKGDGTNGFKKGQWGLQVDADYKSSSKNFTNLQSAANNHDGVAEINTVAPHAVIPTLMGVQQGDKTVVQPFKEAMTAKLAQYHMQGSDNYVSGAEEAFGQTLFPLIGEPFVDSLYTPSRNTQMYIASDMSALERTATFFHELVHIVLGDFGRTIPVSGHGYDTVDQQTKAAEAEARKNSDQ